MLNLAFILNPPNYYYNIPSDSNVNTLNKYIYKCKYNKLYLDIPFLLLKKEIDSNKMILFIENLGGTSLKELSPNASLCPLW